MTEIDWRTRAVVLMGDVLVFAAILAGHIWGGLDSTWVIAAGGNLIGSAVPKAVLVRDIANNAK